MISPVPPRDGAEPAAPHAVAVRTPPTAITKPAVKSAKLTLTLSEAVKLKIVVKKGKKTVSTTSVSAAAGKRVIALAKKKLKKGSYVATITAVDAAGNKTAKTIKFKVK